MASNAVPFGGDASRTQREAPPSNKKPITFEQARTLANVLNHLLQQLETMGGDQNTSGTRAQLHNITVLVFGCLRRFPSLELSSLAFKWIKLWGGQDEQYRARSEDPLDLALLRSHLFGTRCGNLATRMDVDPPCHDAMDVDPSGHGTMEVADHARETQAEGDIGSALSERRGAAGCEEQSIIDDVLDETRNMGAAHAALRGVTRPTSARPAGVERQSSIVHGEQVGRTAGNQGVVAGVGGDSEKGKGAMSHTTEPKESTPSCAEVPLAASRESAQRDAARVAEEKVLKSDATKGPEGGSPSSISGQRTGAILPGDEEHPDAASTGVHDVKGVKARGQGALDRKDGVDVALGSEGGTTCSNDGSGTCQARSSPILADPESYIEVPAAVGAQSTDANEWIRIALYREAPDVEGDELCDDEPDDEQGDDGKRRKRTVGDPAPNKRTKLSQCTIRLPHAQAALKPPRPGTKAVFLTSCTLCVQSGVDCVVQLDAVNKSSGCWRGPWSTCVDCQRRKKRCIYSTRKRKDDRDVEVEEGGSVTSPGSALPLGTNGDPMSKLPTPAQDIPAPRGDATREVKQGGPDAQRNGDPPLEHPAVRPAGQNPRASEPGGSRHSKHNAKLATAKPAREDNVHQALDIEQDFRQFRNETVDRFEAVEGQISDLRNKSQPSEPKGSNLLRLEARVKAVEARQTTNRSLSREAASKLSEATTALNHEKKRRAQWEEKANEGLGRIPYLDADVNQMFEECLPDFEKQISNLDKQIGNLDAKLEVHDDTCTAPLEQRLKEVEGTQKQLSEAMQVRFDSCESSLGQMRTRIQGLEGCRSSSTGTGDLDEINASVHGLAARVEGLEEKADGERIQQLECKVEELEKQVGGSVNVVTGREEEQYVASAQHRTLKGRVEGLERRAEEAAVASERYNRELKAAEKARLDGERAATSSVEAIDGWLRERIRALEDEVGAANRTINGLVASCHARDERESALIVANDAQHQSISQSMGAVQEDLRALRERDTAGEVILRVAAMEKDIQGLRTAMETMAQTIQASLTVSFASMVEVHLRTLAYGIFQQQSAYNTERAASNAELPQLQRSSHHESSAGSSASGVPQHNLGFGSGHTTPNAEYHRAQHLSASGSMPASSPSSGLQEQSGVNTGCIASNLQRPQTQQQPASQPGLSNERMSPSPERLESEHLQPLGGQPTHALSPCESLSEQLVNGGGGPRASNADYPQPLPEPEGAGGWQPSPDIMPYPAQVEDWGGSYPGEGSQSRNGWEEGSGTGAQAGGIAPPLFLERYQNPSATAQGTGDSISGFMRGRTHRAPESSNQASFSPDIGGQLVPASGSNWDGHQEGSRSFGRTSRVANFSPASRTDSVAEFHSNFSELSASARQVPPQCDPSTIPHIPRYREPSIAAASGTPTSAGVILPRSGTYSVAHSASDFSEPSASVYQVPPPADPQSLPQLPPRCSVSTTSEEGGLMSAGSSFTTPSQSSG